jgi:hypothetical protein
MLQMLALIYFLICFLIACQRYLHSFGHIYDFFSFCSLLSALSFGI